MVYYLHDMIEDYADQKDEDIQWKTASRKEFFELKGSSKEKKPQPGEFFNHQNIFLRYTIQYDRIFNIHETGTGKTGSIINLCEHYRIKEPGKIKRFIILQPGPPTVDDFKDQIVKLSTDDFYKMDNILSTTEDKGIKNNLTRLINKNYEVTTYQKFLKDDLTDEKIENYYSDCIFFFDEAHKLRNLSDNSGGELSQDQLDKIYNYLWRITHLAKRSKVIISTATPMINSVKDFVPLINLLLDQDKQFPTVKDEKFYENLTFEQIEPFFRGIFTYVRFLDTLNIKNKGVEFNKFKHIIDIPKEKDTTPLLPDIKYIENSTIVVEKCAKNKVNKDFKKEEITSKINIYPVEMKSVQLETYKKVAKLKNDSFYRSARQSSAFVFPNGFYGTKGFDFYVEKDEFKNYKFKEDFFYKGKLIVSMNKYIDPNNIDKTLKNIYLLGCKFAEYIKIEYNASLNSKPGNSFCYLDQVKGSGVILLGLILQKLGFENFTSNDSSIVDIKTGRIRNNFVKKKRFAIITGQTSNLRNILKVFNSRDNMDGQYIQMILASEVARDGINIRNVLRGYILSPGWHESGMHQALSRFIRADSHTDLLNRKLIELGEEAPKNYKISVDIYRMAAIKPGDLDKDINDFKDSTIDIKNYLEAEEKDIKIKRIHRFMKISAFDAYLNYDRNFRKTDKDFTKVSDYEISLPRIPGSRGKPDNTKREGIAMNQGPCIKELMYNTYNLFYYKNVKDNIKLKQKLFKLLQENNFCSISDIMKTLKNDIRYDHYKVLNLLLEEALSIDTSKKSRDNLYYFSLEIIGSNISISRKNLQNYNQLLSTEDYYSFMEIKDTNQEETDSSSVERLSRLYISLTGKTKSQIIDSYSIQQNYSDYKILLEDSIIRLKNNNLNEVNKNILDLLNNYWMETKIPENWIKESEDALKEKGTRKQGRKRAEGSKAGLKTLDLGNKQKGYSNKKVYIHFYRESDKTGFSITSILEGKTRKIRILDTDRFRDTNTVEEFVYTNLFDQYYDNILEKFKKSKYYGSYIYRGGEQIKELSKRKKEFFRIVDTSNPRNKGRVCINNDFKEVQKIIEFLDTDKKYKDYYTGKNNSKNEACDIIKDLFKKKGLLFVSL